MATETSQLNNELKVLQQKMERLRPKNTEWELEKSVAKTRSHKLAKKVTQFEDEVEEAKAAALNSRADAARTESARLSSKLENLKAKLMEGDAKVRGRVSRVHTPV